MEEKFAELFPEWVLCESLKKSKVSLWDQKVVHLINAPPDQPNSFAEIFPGIKDPRT